MVKLKRVTFKYIESELYMYHETKQEIREEIIHALPVYESESVESSRINDPTARKATVINLEWDCIKIKCWAYDSSQMAR